jgi:glycosyltransferase involved in cell wall biosynthesis
VQFLGYQPLERLRALYRGARALIAASVCYEVFPLVVLEAFQQGAPVIARRLGPYPEIVEASGGGLLFTDRPELAAAVRSLATDEARRDVLGAAARRAFEASWSEEVAVRAYLGLVRSVAASRRLHDVVSAFASVS